MHDSGRWDAAITLTVFAHLRLKPIVAETNCVAAIIYAMRTFSRLVKSEGDGASSSV